MAIRQRGLSQRHRTLLFLVDGRRTLEEVIELGLKAGVPKGYIDELLALGLVVMAAPVRTPPVDLSSPEPRPAERLGRAGPLAVDTASPTPAEFEPEDSADTRLLGLPLSNTELAALDAGDPYITQARDALLQLLREHGNVTTAVTLLRVRRARDRASLLALLPDIRGRLARAGVAAAQLHVVDQAEAWLSA